MIKYNDEWIFYLKLSPKLPEHFFELDQYFKEYGYNLIPVSFPDLLELSKKEESVHVVTIIRSVNEFKYYQKKVSKLMMLLLRMNKVNFFKASSFNQANESSKITHRSNYSFFALPIKREELCSKVLDKVMEKSLGSHHWPGGKVPRMGLTG